MYDEFLHLVFPITFLIYAILLPCFFPPLLHCIHFKMKFFVFVFRTWHAIEQLEDQVIAFNLVSLEWVMPWTRCQSLPNAFTKENVLQMEEKLLFLLVTIECKYVSMSLGPSSLSMDVVPKLVFKNIHSVRNTKEALCEMLLGEILACHSIFTTAWC